ncbi:hypothetical protein ECG_01499 [Echinococcus granulosus]|uniref:Zinc finger CW type PWWP domain protein 1 n=1 Tax=Echinococcus granulosus TaxID=6210 RepID=A0A068WAY2_ECHGR|nr:hypothetical protein ECG_01499 [Echinococcus granulosus]CDS15575.1 zinc finger CW type PWWP domain protein 1 [Echinococcus granulosus]
MVDFDERGLYADYDPVTHKATHYWVVSLEPHVTTAKHIPALCLRDYVPGTLIDETLKKSKHWSRIEKAIEAAEDALKLPIHKAIVEDVSIPLVEQAVLKRPRKIPSAHQVSRAFLPQGVPPNSGGRSTIQEPLQGETFFDFPNCFLKCIPTTSTQKTSSENSNSHFAHTSGSPKMIFYEQFLKNNFPGCTRSREGRNSGSYESTAEESIKSRTFCIHDSCFNKELISTTSLRGILSKDLNGHKRSNSMVNFIKSAIKSKLEGRASMIRQLSVIITNLPFHLQLKPVECHTHAFK